jgi:hypothetical protein
MISCPKCEHEMGTLARFCNECGEYVAIELTASLKKEQAEWKRIHCDEKGHKLQFIHEKPKSFCAYCGKKLHYSTKELIVLV